MVKVMVFLLEFYQTKISPLKRPSCRFYPTCSEYSKQAFLKYGFIKGFMLTILRVSKCHPLHKGGYDPLS